VLFLAIDEFLQLCRSDVSFLQSGLLCSGVALGGDYGDAA